MRIDYGDMKKAAESSRKCQKLGKFIAVYSVMFNAHFKARMTNTEGGECNN